jgi:hypothetical protein
MQITIKNMRAAFVVSLATPAILGIGLNTTAKAGYKPLQELKREFSWAALKLTYAL